MYGGGGGRGVRFGFRYFFIESGSRATPKGEGQGLLKLLGIRNLRTIVTTSELFPLDRQSPLSLFLSLSLSLGFLGGRDREAHDHNEYMNNVNKKYRH